MLSPVGLKFEGRGRSSEYMPELPDLVDWIVEYVTNQAEEHGSIR